MEREGVAVLKVRVMNYGHGISMQRRRDKCVRGGETHIVD